MATLRSFSSDVIDERGHGLCPVCLTQRVVIESHVDVLYEVEIAPGSGEIVVVDERLADSGWDESDGVGCANCGWHGRVSDLFR